MTQADRGEAAARELRVALDLMRMALALLDRTGDTLAAARLQHAIDTALITPDRSAAGSPELIDLGLQRSS